jgi:hypothetical protein
MGSPVRNSSRHDSAVRDSPVHDSSVHDSWFKDSWFKRLESSSPRWNDFWEKLAPRCGYCACVYSQSCWGRMRRRTRGVFLQGTWYCRPECLERALAELFRWARVPTRPSAIPSHRVPLGLLLLSRRQLTAEQLKTTLQAQRAAGRGRIGEWLQDLGYATEPQVTAALARQWSCPVLRTSPEALGAGRVRAVPFRLLETFRMIPVQFIAATGTLLMAFSEGIDYSVLYAVEQMLACHTQPCLVTSSILQKGLQLLAPRSGAGDVVFERMQGSGECARIISNYSANVRAREVRLARCGEYLWAGLKRLHQETVNLILRAPMDSAPALPPGPAAHRSS